MAERHISGPAVNVVVAQKDGEWYMMEVNIKCRALLITRIWLQGQHEGTMMAGWMQYWQLQEKRNNPPIYEGFPTPSTTCVPTSRKWRI